MLCETSISAFGGLLTVVVVKYADNIVKAFATSIAIVLSILLSVLLFDRRPSFQYFIGATLVIIAVCVYGNADLVQSRLPCLPQITAICKDKKDATWRRRILCSIKFAIQIVFHAGLEPSHYFYRTFIILYRSLLYSSV